jgi:hypothetical protein
VKSLTSTEARITAVPGETLMAQPTAIDRFLLWIDAVGGYLVCGGDRVRIGQQSPGNPVEIPLVADLARHHATLRRDGESYLIEPVREVSIGDRSIDRTSPLSNGAELTLSRGVRLRLRLPNPLSATACLDFASRHRTQPTTSGVILLAETCVLGPASTSHIVCRHWKSNIVLHRWGDSLYCVSERPFTVGGVVCRGRAMISPGVQVLGDEFSFSIEAA